MLPGNVVNAEAESDHQLSDMDVTTMHRALIFSYLSAYFPEAPLLVATTLQHTQPIPEVRPATC